MHQYIKLFVSIMLLTLSHSILSMEQKAEPTEMVQDLTAEKHNKQVAILLLPDEIMLAIMKQVAYDLQFVVNAQDISKALHDLPKNLLRGVCRKFRSLTKDKCFKQLHSYYQNTMKASFIEQIGTQPAFLMGKMCGGMITFTEGPPTCIHDIQKPDTFLLTDAKRYVVENDLIKTIINIIPFTPNEDIILSYIKLLIFYGANVNSQNIDGSPILILAVYKDWVKVIRFLSNHPAITIDISDQRGKTPLTIAFWAGNMEIVKLLLAKTLRSINLVQLMEKHNQKLRS